MGWIIGLLTAVLIIDCLFLILLVLIQLPKKEAGMGTAFGGGATDALFGAGTGNALTKMTKYATGIFFVLTLSLSILNARQSKAHKTQFEKELQKAGQEAEVPAAVPAAAAAAPAAKLATNAAAPVAAAALTTTTNSVTAKPAATPPASPAKK